MTSIYRRGSSPSLQFNLTPMIDMVFNLIIFFMLVNRIGSEEVASGVELPEIVGVEAKQELPPNRVVINLLWAGENREPEYRIGAATADTLGILEKMLVATKRSTPDLLAIIRADRRIDYLFVRKVMEKVAKAQIEVMHLAVAEEVR